MRAFTIALASAAFVAGTAPAPAFAQSSGTEVPRDGSCPTGFKQSGSNCVSNNGSVAIEKVGSCPTGWKASSNYCVGDKGDHAEVRSGSCSSGMKASGKYCIKS